MRPSAPKTGAVIEIRSSVTSPRLTCIPVRLICSTLCRSFFGSTMVFGVNRSSGPRRNASRSRLIEIRKQDLAGADMQRPAAADHRIDLDVAAGLPFGDADALETFAHAELNGFARSSRQALRAPGATVARCRDAPSPRCRAPARRSRADSRHHRRSVSEIRALRACAAVGRRAPCCRRSVAQSPTRRDRPAATPSATG